MVLEVHERIALLNLLPTQGDYAALKTIRRAREMISFTPEELKFYELVNVKDASGKTVTQWNSQKAAEVVKDVPLDEYTTNVIRNKLTEMDRKKSLTDEYMSLYDKFVIVYQ